MFSTVKFGSWVRGFIAVVFLALSGLFMVEERAWRRERLELKTAVTAAQSALEAADTRQRQRDAALRDSLAQIAELKRSVTSPQQALVKLPDVLPLPKPIGPLTTIPADATPQGGHAAAPPSPGVILPAEDLKPLYDFALECKACKSQLAAVQGDLADEKAKTQALFKERDAALKAAGGGSLWHRVRTATKWLLIGAAAGAAATAIHH